MFKFKKASKPDQPGFEQLEDYKLLLKLNPPAEPELWQARSNKPEMHKFGLVTLKPIPINPVSPGQATNGLENFQRLAGALSLLRHPTIWPLLDAGNVGSLGYLVFPHYPKAISLKEQLGQKPQPLVRTIDLISQVLESLSFAHRHDVLHGNLTPSNIFMLPNGQVKVLNFGVGKFDFDTNGVKFSDLAGASADYMAPEQFFGYGDFTSDLYSAGILVYRLLVGELPFTGRNKLEISQRHLNEQPPISNEKIPEYLQFFFNRALNKEPGKRFANANQMLKTFRQVASTLPTETAGQLTETNPEKSLSSLKLFGLR